MNKAGAASVRGIAGAGLARLAAGLGAAIAASLSLSGCAAVPLLNRVLVPDEGFALTRGIAYGEAARQQLDVYVPSGAGRAEAAPAKVVVFLYGGGWKSGSRDYYRFVGEAFASRGYVTVIPDYRVYPEVRFPTFVEDAARAVDWVTGNIGRFGGDADAIFLAGHSAGAHIAALLATDERYLVEAGVDPGVIAGLVGLAGPYAFDPFRYDSTRAVFAGLDGPEPMQPVTFVDAKVPPMLLLHGADDTTVYPVNSRKMAEAIEAAGGQVERIEVPDTGHVGVVLALASLFREKGGILDRIDRFIARHAGRGS
jgi:acetyl esterase/lipase